MSTVRYFNPTMRRNILAGREPWWVTQHPRRSYIVAANLSTPDWVDREELMVMHREAKQRSVDTGIEHVLDHIVPLTHPMVCGLTVPWNLRIVTRDQNASKSNRWSPNQLELFPCDPAYCYCLPRCHSPAASPPLLPSSPDLLTIPEWLRRQPRS